MSLSISVFILQLYYTIDSEGCSTFTRQILVGYFLIGLEKNDCQFYLNNLNVVSIY